MDPLAALDLGLVRAENPSPFTLQGTNTWLVGRDPCYVVDPGPALPAHVERVAADALARGGIGGIAVTHDHPDHAGGVAALRAAAGGAVPVAAARLAGADVRLRDDDDFGPLRALATPGHAPDHLAFLAGRALFSGDAVLGHGSVFVFPDRGALRAYLAVLDRLEALDLAVICPGHGPLVLDPAAKLREYREHRRERERRLLDALGAGARSVDELLAHAWADAPAALRPAAALTLAAHLDKLAEEGRLPAGVQRPDVAGMLSGWSSA
ncbi:MAG TPA: MBL fold metallo-hydrolase [Solirubrobacteraceae bacterium]|nr:MBL fold metallo-hydrolase [Solirubrobacteraceae bacterium]